MKVVWATIAACTVALGLASSAQADVRVGELRCYLQPGTGYVVGSAREARCIFSGLDGRREHYVARLKRVGLDVGFTDKSVLVWAVFAPTSHRHHALRGSYVGASADAAVAVGGGVNVLVGGNNSTVSFQPVSLKAQTGLAVAAGVADLELR
jgi:Protein of unknown function (DUF992)